LTYIPKAGNEDKRNWRTKHKQVIWRRGKVHELLITGHNQSQVADILKVSEGTISNDVGYLKEKACDNLKNHLEDRLPSEYENCMAGINQVLKMSWEIAMKGQNEDTKNESSKTDDKTRLQALALANDCYKYKLDLVTNGVIIADAIKFVRVKREEVGKMVYDNTNSIQTQTETLNSNLDSVGSTTTNKIF
jgi:DNA-binding CsgD family transcriptional regulator